MPVNDQILKHCRKLVIQPGYRKKYLLSLKDKYQGVIGYFSNYIPEEIIAAAGFHPLRIIGAFQTSELYRRALFNPVCSFAQDVYAAACSGEFSCLDYMVFPNSCDSLKLLHHAWESEIKEPSAYTLFHPINTDSNSIQYFAEQIKLFAKELQERGGTDFSQTKLEKVIDRYNKTRALLRQLYHRRKSDKTFLSGSDTIALMTAGLIMDREEYNQILEQVVQEGRNQRPQQDTSSKSIMIIGPLMDNVRLLEQIEQCGVTVIDDEITNGSRYFDRDVQTQGDLYKNLAERYLLSGPSPTLNSNMQVDEQIFRNRMTGLDLQGVIFINQKFCEPHVHNYLSKKEILKQMKINYLMLEIEHNKEGLSERDLLRIESFVEIAGRNRVGVE